MFNLRSPQKSLDEKFYKLQTDTTNHSVFQNVNYYQEHWESAYFHQCQTLEKFTYLLWYRLLIQSASTSYRHESK